ncbi:MAG: multidrug effflux MFS transporter [Rhodobacteraceae bacterium]|nr:multidrug effflux MFS transporter [Paracoccaceae bacterium]
MQHFPAVRFLDRSTPPHVLTLIVIAGVSALSMNIFLPSLPGMAEHFGTEYRLMQLSVPVYLWVNAGLQIVVGPVSDRFGRRPVVLTGLFVFLLATLGCLLAPTVEIFLAFRMAQAVVVVGMVLSRAIVRDMVPADQAASMISYVTMGMVVVPMIGPAIGGLLDEAFGWQANFWILALFGLLAFWLCWSDLGETATARSSSFREQFRQYPELLLARRFWGYCLAATFGAGSFFAFLGGAPFVGSEVYGLEPAWLGLYFATPSVGYFLGNFLSGRYSVRHGINRMILIGAAIVVAGVAALMATLLAGLGSAEVFFGFMSLVGLGNGLVMPNATAGMLSVRPHLAGSASGLGGAMMIGGGAGLAALSGALLTPESGAMPLVVIQICTAALSLLAILYVIQRDRRLAMTAGRF